MDEIKSILLTPDLLEDCLRDENFHVIKQKRDIILSLNNAEESKCSKYIADQTPTPTRFIQNCEAVGLFEDLKHVNPFEETFRQAIDNKTKLTTQKSLEIIKCNDEDTLHTPHIIQKDITDTTSIKKTDKDWFLDKSSITTPEILSTQKSVVEKVDTEPSQPEQSDHSKDDNEATIKVRKIHSQIIKKNENTQKILRKICPKPVVIANINPIKEKIRESLLKLQTTRGINLNTNVVIHSTDTISIVEPPISSTGQLENIEIPVKNEIKRKVTNKGIRKFQDDGSNERNRAAAKRYRNKQKLLYDNLLTRNAQLETENAQLKKQLQHFKKIHANCSMIRNDDLV